jgi:hypothetical protein
MQNHSHHGLRLHAESLNEALLLTPQTLTKSAESIQTISQLAIQCKRALQHQLLNTREAPSSTLQLCLHDTSC